MADELRVPPEYFENDPGGTSGRATIAAFS